MKKITVNTPKPYDIVVGKDILKDCGETVKALFPFGKTVVVTDDHVEPLYAEALYYAFDKANIKYATFVLPHGEGSKNADFLIELLDFMAAHHLDRGDFITALGGGVVGDLAGFAAAIYLRGISWIQLPTTLLAAVDASIGGKTAVNLEAGKNLIGAFHQPSLVWCDHDTLKTMEPKYFTDGIAEAVKYALLHNDGLFEMLEEGNLHRDIEAIIMACIEIKARIVTEDTFDNGKSQFLNLGHTVGHAIKARSNDTVSHGHAIACGIVLIAEAAAKNGLAEFDCKERIAAVLSHYDLPIASPYPLSELLPYMEQEKKTGEDKIRLIIPENIGRCRMIQVPVEKLKSFFRI